MSLEPKRNPHLAKTYASKQIAPRRSQHPASRADRANRALERLRSECKRKGISGIRGLCVLFRNMDADYSQSLTFTELRDGLFRYDIKVSEEDLKVIFKRMDNDESGAVDFQEFITKVLVNNY